MTYTRQVLPQKSRSHGPPRYAPDLKMHSRRACLSLSLHALRFFPCSPRDQPRLLNARGVRFTTLVPRDCGIFIASSCVHAARQYR